MALYNIIGQYNISSIQGVVDGAITFIVQFNSIEEAGRINDLIRNRDIYVYKNIYNIWSEPINNIINIKLINKGISG